LRDNGKDSIFLLRRRWRSLTLARSQLKDCPLGYFPEFASSNSIKSVAPAFCPGFSYDDLECVADGAAASGAFLQLASGAVTAPKEIADLRAQLLAYCKRDTLAMVKVHRALMRLTAKKQG
jgi:hypothetical protein